MLPTPHSLLLRASQYSKRTASLFNKPCGLYNKIIEKLAIAVHGGERPQIKGR